MPETRADLSTRLFRYQSELSLTWASIAYTIGSLLLWYEALDKYPVEAAKV